MRNVVEISAQNLYDAVFDACFQANTKLPKSVYSALENLDFKKLESASKLEKIFSNAAIALKNQRPLCQDTGQVVVFVQLGEEVILESSNPETIINKAIADCYTKNFFRKSVVKDAVFDRTNTQNNAPAIIYTEFVEGKEIRVDILIKGGGAENMSSVKMFNPSASKSEIFEFVLETVKTAGENACPPLFLGIGAGGTIDYAGMLSKKSFFYNENADVAQELMDYINENSPTKVAQIHFLSAQTHIACLPVCVTINCHSARHASVLVKKDGYSIISEFAQPEFSQVQNLLGEEVSVSDKKTLRTLKIGEEILLSGTIYTARDMAHKRLTEMIERGEELPFELKDAIIFYAGPCPQKEGEIIGPIGPTTAKRMDKFAPILYEHGVLATIGKGARNSDVQKSIEKNNALYFSIQGGVASLLQNCVKSQEVIAFDDLGAEAVYKLEVEKLPVKLELK